MNRNFQPRHRNIALVVAFAATTLLVGCNDMPTGDILPTVPAGGTLTYQGKPLEYHQVIFDPGQEGRPAAGVSQPDGSFTLGTNDLGDGAPVGQYKVAVRYIGPPPPPGWGVNDFSPIPPPKVKIPAKYQEIQTSGLSVEIPRKGNTELEIQLD